MKKSYLFIYSNTVGAREEVKNHLNTMQSVITWRFDMPNVFYIVSENSANEIAKEFESKAGTNGRFIFLEYNENAQGRLTSDSWHLLSNKYHKEDS